MRESAAPRQARSGWAIALIIVWPFLFLWPYTSGLIAIGNDFDYLYFNYKAYLLISLADGHFPLWSPTEWGGHPFFSNPFTQAVYPFNLLYLGFFLAVGRFSSWHYALFTIMAISIFGVGLYCWLRRLAFAVSAALPVTLIACMSLKVTEMIRFANAAHTAAWMPWLLFGMTVAASRKSKWQGPIVIGIACLMLLTAGYPYYIVYTPFLLGPYFVALLVPRARTALLQLAPAEQSPWLSVLLKIGGPLVVATAIASPWLLHVAAVIGQAQGRPIADLDYATKVYQYDIVGTIGSWIFPPASIMEGWYYFGMPTTLLVLSSLCCLWTKSPELGQRRTAALLVLGWFAVITYFSWGADSALFRFVWQHIPFVNQMRVWPRMNIVLVPGIAFLLAVGITYFRYLVAEGDVRQVTIFAGSCAAIATVIFIAQGYMAGHHLENLYWSMFYGCPSCGSPGGLLSLFVHRVDETTFPRMTVFAASLLCGGVVLGHFRPARRRANRLTAALVALSILDLFWLANDQWPRPDHANGVERSSLASLLGGSFTEPRRLGPGTADPVSHTQAAGLIEANGFMRHAAVFNRYFRSDGSPQPAVPRDEIIAATRFFGADRSAKRLFLTARIDYDSPIGFMADVDAMNALGNSSISVEFFDGDTLRLEVESLDDGWLSYIDNWDPNWRATRDGKEVPIMRLLGSYKSVAVPKGHSTVVFSYEPGLFPAGLR